MMGRHSEYFEAKEHITRETDAEIAFGEFLERSGVDHSFMKQCQISHSQFNAISHFVYGLSDDLSMPSACPRRHADRGSDHRRQLAQAH